MTRQTILVVDDNELVRRALAVQLRAGGYRTVFAADGIQALTVARRECPDLVILDLGLPGGDGYVVLDRLGALPALACTPVVVLTGWGEERERCLESGAAAFFTKPVAWRQLHTAIEAALPATTAGLALAVAR